jgi:hypothetical protein
VGAGSSPSTDSHGSRADEIPEKPRPFIHAWAACRLASAPGIAALPQGSAAPNFTLDAAKGGKQFHFTLNQSLRKGPVVLYFFPAAFTPGCTMKRIFSPKPPTVSARWAPPSLG